MMYSRNMPAAYLVAAIAVFMLSVLTGPAGLCHADDGQPDIKAEVKNEKIHIGDSIKLDVTVPASGPVEYILPEKPDNTGEFTFFSSRDIREGMGRTARRGREYIMGIYTTGPHVIPPVTVMYREKGREGWLTADSNQVPVVIDSVLTGNDEDIKDLKGIARYKRGPLGMSAFAVSVAALAALLAALWRRLREKTMTASRKALLPYEIAYKELDRLKDEDLPGRGRIKEYYSRLSGIIREYIGNRFLLRAPEMTTEEFMEEAKGSSELDDGQKTLLVKFLSHCDMVKFAKYGPTPLEMIDSFKAARNFVDQTRREEEPAEGGEGGGE